VLEELSEELLYLALGRSERAPAGGSDAVDPATSGAGPLHRGPEVASALQPVENRVEGVEAGEDVP
jgi:hypothetical protein